MKLILSPEAYLEVMNLRDGVFAPLQGFLGEQDFRCVVDSLRLEEGAPWPLPVTLEVPETERSEVSRSTELELVFADDGGEPKLVGRLAVESVFIVTPADVGKVFGVLDRNHPGVRMELEKSPVRVGGKLLTDGIARADRSPYYLSPVDVASRKTERGWRTMVGFQTRNAIHRAHEYLQRVGLEVADGLFIQPLTGWKKSDDASAEQITAAYQVMIDRFYPEGRVVFSVLETYMRYAGPREAVFHAIIRRNYGCTHFIVGRDHAGVGGFYGKYAAHEQFAAFPDLGIEILALAGPFYCETCGQIVTERSCRHVVTATSVVKEISGSLVREYLDRREYPPDYMMRREVAAALLTTSLAKDRS